MNRKRENSSEVKELGKLLSRLRIGNVDPQKLLKENDKITSTLLKVIEESNWTGGYEEIVGILMYNVAIHFPPRALACRPLLLGYVTSLKIRTLAQLNAACAFFSALGSKKLDIKEFEAFCGIGITEGKSLEIMQNAVDEIYEEYKNHMNRRKSDEVIANELKVRVQMRLQWAEPSMYMDYIWKKLTNRKHNDGHKSREKNKEKCVEEFAAAEEKSAKIKVHAKGVDIGTRPLNELFVLGDRIKAKITTSYETPYTSLFVLPCDEEVKKDPYCLLRIFTGSFEVTYIICKVSLYVVAWITSEENVVRVFKSEEQPADVGFRKIKSLIEKMPVFQYLKPKIVESEYPGSYVDLQNHAEKYRYDIDLGRKHLEGAIYTLCRPTILPKETAKALIISLQMLPEVMRLRQMKNFVRMHYENGEKPSPRLTNLQNKWSTLSQLIIKWAETGEYFEIVIDDIEYGVKDVSRSILIAKNSKGRS